MRKQEERDYKRENLRDLKRVKTRKNRQNAGKKTSERENKDR